MYIIGWRLKVNVLALNESNDNNYWLSDYTLEDVFIYINDCECSNWIDYKFIMYKWWIDWLK